YRTLMTKMASGVCAYCETRFEYRRSRHERRYCQRCAPRGWQVHHRYGLTKPQWDDMFEAQGGACLLCDRTDQRLCVDHCHETGRVRGLLCHRCNAFLGVLENVPGWYERAVDYLGQVVR